MFMYTSPAVGIRDTFSRKYYIERVENYFNRK